jgi:hypothetical protein
MSGIDGAGRYGPHTPWATHSWTDDPFWGDSCWFCADCDAPSFGDAAHAPCPGRPEPAGLRLSTAVLIKPRELS